MLTIKRELLLKILEREHTAELRECEKKTKSAGKGIPHRSEHLNMLLILIHQIKNPKNTNITITDATSPNN